MGLTFRQEIGECVKGAATGAVTISSISLCITHKCKEHINRERITVVPLGKELGAGTISLNGHKKIIWCVSFSGN